MWADQQQEIAQQRMALLVRSQALRQRLGEQAQALERPLALADRARSQLRWLRDHPQWLLALGLLPLLPVLLRPRRLFGWTVKLWSGWRLWRQVRAFLPLGQAGFQPPWKPPAR